MVELGEIGSDDCESFVTATLGGWAVILLTGAVLFTIPAVADFYRAALMLDEGVSAGRPLPLLWAALVGALAYATLVTLVIALSTSRGIVAGIRIGAIVGVLVWGTANFMLFSISHVGTVATTLVAPLLELLPGAAAGGVIVRLLSPRRERASA